MTTSTDPFVEISYKADSARLLNVLEQRLPTAAHEYNLLFMNSRHPRNDIHIYTLGGNLIASSIVLINHHRQDYDQDIAISIPSDYEPGLALKEALLKTKAINWKAAYYFTSIERRITPIIVEISTVEMKNSIMYNPNQQFTFDTKEALEIDLSSDIQTNQNIQIRPLDKDIGAKFLVDNWKYSKEGTLEWVHGLLEHHPNVGIYIDDGSNNLTVACGAIVTYHGLIGLLYTDKNYRRLGLAHICMRYLFKEMAKEGLFPLSSCQIENQMSSAFHRKLGMVMTHETDYIRHMTYSEKL